MPTWFPRSTFGLVLATVYIIVAVLLIQEDRKERGGGWISLHGMTSFLVTFPVSAVGEWLGVRPNFRSNVQMTVAVGLCAAMVYLAGAYSAKLVRFLFQSASNG